MTVDKSCIIRSPAVEAEAGRAASYGLAKRGRSIRLGQKKYN